MSWDYVFVGAGPASLLAAGLLSRENRGARILILETGEALSSRGCPGMRRHTCTNCSGDGCRVIMGVGGSSAGFGNKLCHFPASSGVLSLIPSELLQQVHDIVTHRLGRDFDVEPEIATIPLASVRRKFYSADVLFRKQYASLVGALLSALQDKVEVRSRTSVREVHKTSEGFEVRLASSETIWTRKLILGTGRAGHRFVRETLTSLGASYGESLADIGIRLEARTDLFSDAFFYQNDPKFKFEHAQLGSSRTFCACRGGGIVPVKFGNGFFADGAFVNAPTGVTNAALMVRSDRALTSNEIDEWCKSVNMRSGRSLLLGEVSTRMGSVSRDILDRIPVWPSQAHRSLMSELLDNVVGGKHVHMFKPTASEEVVRIYGPAVDLYWPLPALSQGFRTAIDGLSVIGDAAGLSRGIVQAMTSGAAWALVEARGVATYDEVRADPSSSAAA